MLHELKKKKNQPQCPWQKIRGPWVSLAHTDAKDLSDRDGLATRELEEPVPWRSPLQWTRPSSDGDDPVTREPQNRSKQNDGNSQTGGAHIWYQIIFYISYHIIRL